MRALRFTSTILPRPGIVNEFLASLYASFTNSSTNWPAAFFDTPVRSARFAKICDFVNFAINTFYLLGLGFGGYYKSAENVATIDFHGFLTSTLPPRMGSCDAL